jgi:hypothetical protein
MNEAKPFASLSSTLLARKGHAKPAMRPQGFQMMGEATPRVIHHDFSSSNGHLNGDHDDLGWNDMGHDSSVDAPVAMHNDPLPEAAAPPPVVNQQERLEQEFGKQEALEAIRKQSTRAAPGSKGKAAFTLRLDSERHFRLRLVCAVNHRSAQQIVTLALDEYLARQPDNAALAVRSAK